MEKTNQNLLQKLTQILNVDKIISPEDIQAIRDALIGVLANNKKELESLTDETKQAVNSILDKVLTEHDTYLEKTKQIAQEAKYETTEAINSTLKSLEEVKALCKEIMECKPENGADADEEYVIGEVLNRIKLPEYKEIVLDDGGAIVDKINSLPVNEENQIDAKHIKNLPEGKGGRIISGGVTRKIVEQMIAASGGGGTPGGSTTQLQYNNAGAFGGISGATTDGTAVTYTANNLKAADVTASGSGGFLIQSNSGTDVGLFGAGGGAGATFYGGVNTEDAVSISKSVTGAFTGLTITNSSTAGGDDAQISFRVANLSTARAIIRAVAPGGSDTELAFYTSNSNGAATEKVRINDVGSVGLLTTAPTHTLTLASTGTGIALYNTADQTTNYERVLMQWSANIFNIQASKGGTGTVRLIDVNGTRFQSSGFITNVSGITAPNFFDINYAQAYSRFFNPLAQSSGTGYNVVINPTLTQTGTAGYTALLVNPTETTTGSGSKLLADFQVGGSSKASINNTGAATLTGTATTLSGTGSLLTGLRISGVGTRYIGVQVQGQTISDLYFGRALSQDDFIVSRANQQTNELFRITNAGLVGIGLTPTAVLHLKAGTATASTAPLKFTAGTGLTAPEAGTMEFSSSETGLTFTAVSTRRAVVLDTATQTLTNKFITPQVQSVADAGGTLTPVSITNDIVIATALSQATTIAAPTGSPVQGEKLTIRLKDNGTARALTWNAIYRAIGVTLPTTTVISKIVYVGCIYNSTDTKWDVVSVAQEA